MNFNFRLKTKILIPTALIVVFSIFTTSGIYLSSQIDTVDSYFENLLIRTSELYQIGLALALSDGDFEDAETAFNKLKSDPLIDFVQIFDDEDDEICDLGGSLIEVKQLDLYRTGGIFEIDNFIVYSSRITKKNEFLGIIFLGIDKNRKSEKLNDLFTQTIYLTIVLLLISVLGIRFILSVILDKPLKNFMKSLDKIITGDLSFELKIDTSDEFFDLAKSFNLMIYELNKTRHVLMLSNEALEETKMDLIKDIVEKILYEKELIYSKEEAVKANEDKSALLRHITHELRTPMNSVLGFSQKLLKGENSDENVRDYSKIINENSKRLLNLINDILDFSKMKSLEQSKDIEKVDYSIFTDLLKSLEPLLKSDQISLKLSKEETLASSFYTNKKMLIQIIINLMGNALKFTNEGSVELRIEEKTFEYIRFSILDTGIGISEKHIEHIFDEFYQVSGESESKKGNGLGLNITKNLVEKLGGTISVKSTYGEGSEFSFFIKNHDPILLVSNGKTSKESMVIELTKAERSELELINEIQFFRKKDLQIHINNLKKNKNNTLLKKVDELSIYLENHQKEQFFELLNLLLQNDTN